MSENVRLQKNRKRVSKIQNYFNITLYI